MTKEEAKAAGIKLDQDLPDHFWTARGDIIRIDDEPHMVDFVNDCRTRCLLNRKKAVEFETMGDKKVSFSRPAGHKNVSRRLPIELLIQRTGEKGYQTFLADKRSRRQEPEQTSDATEPQTETNEDDMKNATKRPARGGLAADVRDAKAAEAKSKKKTTPKAKGTKKPSTGRLGEIFGHSATSVMRALGKAGCKAKEVEAIMKAKKINSTSGSIAAQTWDGQKGLGTIAPLTREQIKELRDLVPSEPANAAA